MAVAFARADQFLILSAANGDDERSAFGELRGERRGNFGRGRGDENGVERREILQAERAVARVDVNIGVAES